MYKMIYVVIASVLLMNGNLSSMNPATSVIDAINSWDKNAVDNALRSYNGTEKDTENNTPFMHALKSLNSIDTLEDKHYDIIKTLLSHDKVKKVLGEKNSTEESAFLLIMNLLKDTSSKKQIKEFSTIVFDLLKEENVKNTLGQKIKFDEEEEIYSWMMIPLQITSIYHDLEKYHDLENQKEALSFMQDYLKKIIQEKTVKNTLGQKIKFCGEIYSWIMIPFLMTTTLEKFDPENQKEVLRFIQDYLKKILQDEKVKKTLDQRIEVPFQENLMYSMYSWMIIPLLITIILAIIYDENQREEFKFIQDCVTAQ